MDYRLSKLAKTIIIINIVLTIAIAIIHGYNIHRIEVTQEKILTVMEEMKVNRDEAIEILEHEGEELFIHKELTTYFGIFSSILTLFLLYKFSKGNGFFFAFAAAFCSLVTSFVGGLLLFYVILSEKGEIKGRKQRFSLKDEWERFIHKKAITTDNTADKE